MGFDRHFNYYKIQYATLCIRENPGCLFIATNRDAVTHLTDAQFWAGTLREGWGAFDKLLPYLAHVPVASLPPHCPSTQ